MPDSFPRVRLRQAVIVAGELEPVTRELRGALDLAEPFCDPGVGEFGLRNAVFALGDCFLEVIAPVREGTAAGRQLERLGGDGGYMAIFDLEDLDAARERVSEMGVRVVWRIDLPDISGTHLHPADVPGAIVSIDRSRPYGSWRWGGPAWTGRVGTGAPGRLTGMAVAVDDPGGCAWRWADVLGVAADDCAIELENATVSFQQAAPGEVQRIVELSVQLPARVRDGRESVEVGGVRLALADLPE